MFEDTLGLKKMEFLYMVTFGDFFFLSSDYYIFSLKSSSFTGFLEVT